MGKANERKRKVKGGKDEEVNGQGGKRGAPAPHRAYGKIEERNKDRVSITLYSTLPPSTDKKDCH